jgi:hypothetical protein
MQLLWPWALLGLLPVAAAAVLALRRPAYQVIPVGSLRLWQKVIEDLGPSAGRSSRHVTLAWALLLTGAAAGALAMSRPVVSRGLPVRNIAIAIYPGAELAGDCGAEMRSAGAALVAKLSPADRVRLILPDILGGAGDFVSVKDAQNKLRTLPVLPVPSAELVVPEAGAAAQHLYRLAPARLESANGPDVTTIRLATKLGDVTIDAFSAEEVPAGGTESPRVQAFVALKNQSAAARSVRVFLARENDPPQAVDVTLPAGARQSVIADLPAGGQWYTAQLTGVNATGAGTTAAEFAAMSSDSGRASQAGLLSRACVARQTGAPRTVAMLGRDDPHVRRFVQINPALRLVGKSTDAQLVIAIGVDPPAGKPALVIDPPTPPAPFVAAGQAGPVALADATMLTSDPILAGADLSAVAIRRYQAWNAAPDETPPSGTLVAIGRNPLIVSRTGPARVYLAFDAALDNTNLSAQSAFVVLLANAVEFLAPSAGPGATYAAATPLSVGQVRDWQPLWPAGAAATPGPLPWPGAYRDALGQVRAVSLTGLSGASSTTPPADQIAALTLPAPAPAEQPIALWPYLALAALALWLAGWSGRLR